MNNPCEECIVHPMCKNLCSELSEYLNIYLPNFPNHGEYTTSAVGKALRIGMIELCDNNNKGWRYIGQWKEYEKSQGKYGVQL